MRSYLKKRPPTKWDTNLGPPNRQWRFFVNWLFESLMPGVPVISTVGETSLKFPASIWRSVVFVAFFTMLTTSAMADITFSAELQATGEEQTMLKPQFKEFSDNFPYLHRGNHFKKKCSEALRTVCLPSLCEIDYSRGDGSGYGKIIHTAWQIEASSYTLNKHNKCLTSYVKTCNKRHWAGRGIYHGHHVIYAKCPTVQSWSSTQLKENLSFRASDGYKWLTDYEGQIGSSKGIPNTVTNVRYSAKIIPGSKKPSNAAISVGMFNGHPNATEENGSQFWVINPSIDDEKLVLSAYTNSSPICQGTEFEVTVKAENTVAVDGAEIYLKFDPSQLQVRSITTSSHFDTELLSEYDNSTGSIEFMALDSKLITDSSFDIFTIKFSSIGTDSSTRLEFLNGSQFTAGFDSLPSLALSNKEINFAYCLNYQVDLQRAKAKGNASWMTDLNVSVGTLTDAIEYTSTTNELGEGILMLNKPLGTTEYFCVKGAQSLASKVIPPFTTQNGKISLSENNEQSSPLLEGDVAIKGSNNAPIAGFDGIINLLDILYVKKNEIDLDKSGDFTGEIELLKANMQKIPLNGKKKRESACIETATINGSMLRSGSRGNDNRALEQLLANALPTGLVQGESFDVILTTSATDTHPVDGTQINLEYDPDSLRINTVTPTESLDILLSDFDNSQGLLNLIAIAWKTPPLTSTFDLVSINFTLLKEGGEKTLHFSEDERQESMIYAGDQLVEKLEEVILPQAEISSNEQPVAVFVMTPEAGNAPLTIALDASASKDIDGTLVSYAWTTSDGKTANGQNAELTFNEAGDNTITLKVTDNDGATNSTTKNVKVEFAGKYSASGTILDEFGKPIPGVTIQIGEKTVVTDASGEWAITDLPEGEYQVIATKDNYTFPVKACAVGNDENCTVKLKPGSVLNVKVVPNSWKPAQGENVTYTITVTNQGDEIATAVKLTDILPEGTSLVSMAALEGGECDADTVTCSLPDLPPGATATAKLVINNAQAKALVNKATVTANEYPDDVQTTWTAVKPYLSVTLSDTPDPVTTGTTLHYTADVDLNQYAPTTTATGIQLVMQLPKGVELKSLNTDYGVCDTSKLPTVICELTDLSIDSPDAISHITVHADVLLNDPGLLLLTHEAKVTANEYPAHTDRERTSIVIPEGVEVDIAFVIDVTGSMQEEINGVVKALKQFIAEIDPNNAPLIALVVFTDDVKIKAYTRDLTVLLGEIEKLKAAGGGTCPEASVEALLIAVPHTKEGGDILFATDASPYADADVEKVMALLRAKGIRFNAMITGDCSNESDWNQLPE